MSHKKSAKEKLLKKKAKEYLDFSPHVAEIFSPLKSLGLVGFFYVRIYPNGEFLDLTSNPKFAEYYFKKFFDESYPQKTISDHLYLDQGVSLWELNPHSLIYQEGRQYFSYGNGITLCENHLAFKEIYSFYAMADQKKCPNFF